MSPILLGNGSTKLTPSMLSLSTSEHIQSSPKIPFTFIIKSKFLLSFIKCYMIQFLHITGSHTLALFIYFIYSALISVLKRVVFLRVFLFSVPRGKCFFTFLHEQVLPHFIQISAQMSFQDIL